MKREAVPSRHAFLPFTALAIIIDVSTEHS
jgi:hypothetical protein